MSLLRDKVLPGDRSLKCERDLTRERFSIADFENAGGGQMSRHVNNS